MSLSLAHLTPTALIVAVLVALMTGGVLARALHAVMSGDRVIALGWGLGGAAVLGTGMWSTLFALLLARPHETATVFTSGLVFVAGAMSVSGMALMLGLARLLPATGWRLAAQVAVVALVQLAVFAVAAVSFSATPDWPSAMDFLVVALPALTLGLWLMQPVSPGSPGFRRSHRIVGASAFGLGLCAAQLQAVLALTPVAIAGPPAPGALNQVALGVGVVAGALIVLLALVGVLVEAHARKQTAKLAQSLEAAQDELSKRAHVDTLTGLPDRQMFEHRLANAVARCDNTGEALAVLFIDLDGFKAVNDAMGHGVGDAVLRQVGERLGELIDDAGLVARVSADEFLMLVEGRAADAGRRARRVLDALAVAYALDPREVFLTCSIGIANYPAHGPLQKLLARADTAMFAAKRAGGATYAFYEPRMEAGAGEQAALLRDLRRAVESNQLELFYQPKIDAQSGRMTGTEALLRWHHPEQGMISPVVFIPIAERFGLIGALGNWVIEEACRQAGLWHGEDIGLPISINLSAYQMRQDDLIDRLSAALQRNDVEASCLTCEITESVAMEDTMATQRAFHRLGAAGIHVSIDDFGTGYSSLAYLRRLPASELKIDRSFVTDLETSADARAIVQAVIRLAHALSLKVVAEGVETEPQRDLLVAMDCDEMQGYLFARPMPAKALLAWARAEQDRVREAEFVNGGEGL